MSAPSLGPGMNQPQPTPAPLQTGTPGTPVDAGQVQVTAKSNGSNANARQFWLTSSAHQGYGPTRMTMAWSITCSGVLIESHSERIPLKLEAR